MSNKAVSQQWKRIVLLLLLRLKVSFLFISWREKRGDDETLCTHCCWNLMRLEVAVGWKTIAWQWEPWLAAPLILFIYLFECGTPAPSCCLRQGKKSARPWRQEDFLPPAADESGAQVSISAVPLSARVRGGRRERRISWEQGEWLEATPPLSPRWKSSVSFILACPCMFSWRPADVCSCTSLYNSVSQMQVMLGKSPQKTFSLHFLLLISKWLLHYDWFIRTETSI